MQTQLCSLLPYRHQLSKSLLPFESCFKSDSSRRVGSKFSRLRCRAEEGDQLSERLKAAESEAQQLRKQLEEARKARGGTEEAAEAPKQKSSRIDGSGLQRETLFGKSTEQWLSEATFLTGDGPGEVIDQSSSSPEQAAIVKRRLILGVALTAVVGGLSLLPTDVLGLNRSSKPLFFYLTPLVRVQALLKDLEQAAIDGETDEVQSGIQRIQGAPNFAVDNLRSAAGALPDSRAAENARAVARDVIEYLDSIDYNRYFDSMQKPAARSGQAQQMFLDFSLKSIRAAQAKLKAFFQLMPADQLEAAQQQATPNFSESS